MMLVWLHSACQTPFLPPASTFPASVPAQTSWNRMKVPKRLILPVTWDLVDAKRTKTQVSACPGGKAPPWVLSSYPVQLDCFWQSSSWLVVQGDTRYLYQKTFISFMGHEKERKNSHGDTRLLSCWLSWIFCVRFQQGENHSIFAGFDCRANKTQNEGLNFSSRFSHLKWESLGLEALLVTTW